MVREELVTGLVRLVDATTSYPIDVDALIADWNEDDREEIKWYSLPSQPNSGPYLLGLVYFEWYGGAPMSTSESWDLVVFDSEHAYFTFPTCDDLQRPWLLVRKLASPNDREDIAAAILNEFAAEPEGGMLPTEIHIGSPELVAVDVVRRGLMGRFEMGADYWTWSDVLAVLVGVEPSRWQKLGDAATKGTLSAEDKTWILDEYLVQARCIAAHGDSVGRG